ncbi:hypothetical protein HZS_6487 [Henneguya salminicola]|nr:hypothetical protein HZS_6487 [Henneguya salminicola]
MNEDNKDKKLEDIYSAGVSGSFKTIQQMSLYKRTPLSTLSQNIDPYFSHKRELNKHTSFAYDDLLCLEELNSSSISDSPENEQPQNYWKCSLGSVNSTILVEIFNEMIKSEIKLCSLSLYLSDINIITPLMRSTLVEWMADVSHGCQHSPETLFMAVNYLDRFMSIKKVILDEFQLIGITCLFISSKLNDVNLPQINEFVYVTENLYTRDNIIDTEKEIISALEFQLVVPTLLFFAELYFSYFKNLFVLETQLILLQALCEYTLIDYKLSNSYYPSILAAAILLRCVHQCDQNLNIEEFTIFGLDLAAISACYRRTNDFIHRTNNMSSHSSSTIRFQSHWYYKFFLLGLQTHNLAVSLNISLPFVSPKLIISF